MLVVTTIDNSSYGSLGEFLLLKTLTTMLSFECHFLGLNSFFKNLIKHLKWSSTTKYRKHLRRRSKRIKNSLHYYLNIWSFFFSCEIAFFRLQRGTNIHQIVTYICSSKLRHGTCNYLSRNHPTTSEITSWIWKDVMFKIKTHVRK